MFDCYITFRSITGAQRGARALTQAGIHNTMVRTPAFLAANGCGYSLRVRALDLQQAASELQRWNIRYSRLYRMRPDGVSEETAP